MFRKLVVVSCCRFQRVRKNAVNVGVCLASGVLLGCGNEPPPSSQIVAMVDGQEITVHQFNHELGRVAGQHFADDAEQLQEVMDRLIDRQLLAKQAEALELERKPRVLQALRAARQQVLAEAYLETVLSYQSPPTEQEISDFYLDRPELFSERKVYQFHELSIDGEISLPELQKIASENEDLEEIASVLEQKKIAFKRSAWSKAAEDIPLEFLSKAHAMTVGQITVSRFLGRMRVLRLNNIAQRPVSQEQAQLVIQNFLIQQKRRDASQQELKRLREASVVEILQNSGNGSKPRSPSATQQSTTKQLAVEDNLP